MMRMLLFTLLASNLLLFGCKKSAEALPQPPQAKHNVSFTVSNFDLKSNATTFSADTLKNFVYYIYDSKGSRVKSTDQELVKSSTSVIIKENLPPGTYKYIFFSSEKPLDTHVSDEPGEVASFVYASSTGMFHKAVEVTVGSNVINQPVVLEKLNSTLEVSLLDNVIPDNVASIQISWTDNKYLNFGGDSFTSTRKQKSINIIPGTRIPEKFSTSILNTSTPIIVNIYYVDKNGRYVNAKELTGVNCFKNQKTLISGYLFNTPSPEFQATVNSKESSVAASMF